MSERSRRSWWKNRKTTKRFRPKTRVAKMEQLEDRRVMATFAEAFRQLNLDLDTANKNLEVSSQGSTYTLKLNGDTWKGTDTRNVKGAGSDTLTVETAGLAGTADIFHPQSIAQLKALNSNSPSNQSVDKAFDDDPKTKYLAFDKNNAGLDVQSKNGAVLVQTLRLLTAEDAPERDPASYVLEAKNPGFPGYRKISEGTLSLPNARGAWTAIHLNNNEAFSEYRLRFPTVKDPNTANSMQIAEIEFLGQPKDTLAITDSAAGANVTFKDSGTHTYAHNIQVNLDEPAAGTIRFQGNSKFSGLNKLIAETTRDIVVDSGAVVTASDGELTLRANQQPSITQGNFSGIEVQGKIEATGKSNVTLHGRSGENSTASRIAGVLLPNNGQIVGGATGGAVRVTGTAGKGTGLALIGVFLKDSGKITSRGSIIEVTGTGGEGPGGFNYGVGLDPGDTLIQAGPLGTVTVVGTGGGGAGGSHAGVALSGGTIASTGGNVSVTGTGGGTGNAGDAYGVWVTDKGTITAGSTAAGDPRGAVIVTGTGGAGTGPNNDGVRVNQRGGGATAKITSAQEPVVITGTKGSSSGAGIFVDKTISHTGSGSSSSISLVSDSINITNNADITAGSHKVVLRPKTNGTAIDVGGADKPATLGLTDAELDKVTAANLEIGSLQAGTINVTANITRPQRTNVKLLSGTQIILSPGNIDAAGGTVSKSAPGASFAQSNNELNIDLNIANRNVSVVANGNSLTFTLDTGTWVGQNSSNVSGADSTTLTVTSSGISTFSGGINIADSASGTNVTFKDSQSGSYSNHVRAILDDPGAGTIRFEGKTEFTGVALLLADTSRDIVVQPNSVVKTEQGELTLQANQQASTKGDFSGIVVSGLVATQSGALTLKGRASSGSTSNGRSGVLIGDGGTVVGGKTARLRIEGHGGQGTGSSLAGITLNGKSKIASDGGRISIEGVGGEGAGTNNHGVSVESNDSLIEPGGNGTLDVTGLGGGGTGSFHTGVTVSAGTITSKGGHVTVDGTGGGTGGAGDSYGVWVTGTGTITAGGSGRVVVSGRGGNSTGSNNDGVRVSQQNSSNTAKITSAKESVVVAGVAGKNSGVGIYVDKTISHTGSGSNSGIALITDTINITSNGSVSAGNNEVVIHPRTPGLPINLGSRAPIQLDLTTPGDPTSEGDGQPIPTRTASNAIDNNLTNDFAHSANNGRPFLEVTLKEASKVTGLRFHTTDQDPGRDPARYRMFGVTGSNFSLISEGSLSLPTARRTWSTPVTFTNNTAYQKYRVDFPDTRTSGLGIVHFSEMELLGDTPAFGLTDAELDRVATSKLVIGDVNAGPISATSAITRPNQTDVHLLSAKSISGEQQVDAAGGTVRKHENGLLQGGTLRLDNLVASQRTSDKWGLEFKTLGNFNGSSATDPVEMYVTHGNATYGPVLLFRNGITVNSGNFSTPGLIAARSGSTWRDIAVGQDANGKVISQKLDEFYKSEWTAWPGIEQQLDADTTFTPTSVGLDAEIGGGVVKILDVSSAKIGLAGEIRFKGLGGGGVKAPATTKSSFSRLVQPPNSGDNQWPVIVDSSGFKHSATATNVSFAAPFGSVSNAPTPTQIKIDGRDAELSGFSDLQLANGQFSFKAKAIWSYGNGMTVEADVAVSENGKKYTGNVTRLVAGGMSLSYSDGSPGPAFDNTSTKFDFVKVMTLRTPGGVITAGASVSGSGLVHEQPGNELKKAFDGDASTKAAIRASSVGGAPQFIISPSHDSVVKQLRILSSPDQPDRDPARYKLYGGTNLTGGGSRTLIAEGAVSLPNTRNAWTEIAISNTERYDDYIVEFTESKGGKNGGAEEVHFAEIQLIGSRRIEMQLDGGGNSISLKNGQFETGSLNGALRIMNARMSVGGQFGVNQVIVEIPAQSTHGTSVFSAASNAWTVSFPAGMQVKVPALSGAQASNFGFGGAKFETTGTTFGQQSFPLFNGKVETFSFRVDRAQLSTQVSTNANEILLLEPHSANTTQAKSAPLTATARGTGAEQGLFIKGKGTLKGIRHDNRPTVGQFTFWMADVDVGGNGQAFFSTSHFADVNKTYEFKLESLKSNSGRTVVRFGDGSLTVNAALGRTWRGQGVWLYQRSQIPVSISQTGSIAQAPRVSIRHVLEVDPSLPALNARMSFDGLLEIRPDGAAIFHDRSGSQSTNRIWIEGEPVPIQLVNFQFANDRFSTAGSPYLQTSKRFSLSGIELEDTSARIDLPNTQQNPNPYFRYRSGRTHFKLGDTTGVAEITVPMSARGGGLFIGDQATMKFEQVSLQGITFDPGALVATYRQSDRRFSFKGQGDFFGVKVNIGSSPGEAQLIAERGVFKLTNFNPPTDVNIPVEGILFRLQGLTRSIINNQITYRGQKEIHVGGAKIVLDLGKDGTDGLVLNLQTKVVEKIGAKITGEFTVGGVKINGDLTFKYEVADKKITITGQATAEFMAAGSPVKVTLRLGTSNSDGLVIKDGQVESVTASITADFTLFGLEVKVQDLGLIYTPAQRTYGIFGKIAISTPDKGGTRVIDNLAVELGTGPTAPGILIRSGELDTLDIKLSGTLNIGGASASPENLRLQYSRATSLLTLTGGIKVTIANKFTASAAFPGQGLQIDTSTGEVQLKGLEIKVGDVQIGPIGVKELSFTYEEDAQGNVSLSGAGMLALPAGIEVEGGFVIKNNRLSAITIGLTKNPGIPVGSPPVVYVNSIKGEVKNLDDLDNFSIEATVGATVGPSVKIFGQTHALAEVEGSIFVDKTKLELSGNFKLVGGVFGSGSGKATIFFQGKDLIKVDANVKMYPGEPLRGNLHFSLDRLGNVTFKGTLEVYVPNGIPTIGGKRLGYLGVYLQIRPNEAKSNSFARFSAGFDLSVAEGHVNAQVDFEGRVKGDYLFRFLFFKKRGNFNFTLPGAREFVIPILYDDDTPTFTDVIPAPPTLTIDSVTPVAGTAGASIIYTGTTTVPNETVVELFVDTEPRGYEGQYLTTIPYQAGQQTYTWKDFAAHAPVPYDPNKPLYVYGLIDDGLNIPEYTAYSAPVMPPNKSPQVQLPPKQDFGPNQPLVFSNLKGNAIQVTDPLAADMPDAEVTVTLDAGMGTLTLKPENAKPWQNPGSPSDVNSDGKTSPLDVLTLLQVLRNPFLGTSLPDSRPESSMYYDINGDGKLTPNDALVGINVLEAGNELQGVAGTGDVQIEQDGSVLKLTGKVSEINAVLDGLTYEPNENAFFDDHLRVGINRFPAATNTPIEASFEIIAHPLMVGTVDGSPLLPLNYTQGSGHAMLLGDVVIQDAASGRLTGMMVAIEGYVPGKDMLDLAIDDQLDLGIEAHFNAHTGVLSINGTEMIETYQAALELIEFVSNGTGSRQLKVAVGDDVGNQASVSQPVRIMAANLAPIVETGTGGVLSSSVSEIGLNSGITVSDDENKLASATVTFDSASYVNGQDMLSATVASGSSITASFDAATGVLTLTGEAPASEYSQALSSIVYGNTAAANARTSGVRRLTLAVSDGPNTTDAALQILVSDSQLAAPEIAGLPANVELPAGMTPLQLAPNLTISQTTGTGDLFGATIAITNNFMMGEDFLRVKGLPEGITGQFDEMAGALRLSGQAPVSFYEFALQNVTLANFAETRDGRLRTISFSVDDGFTTPEPRAMTAVAPAIPVVHAGMSALSYAKGQTSVTLTPELTLDYMGGTTLSGAKVAFVWNFMHGEDKLTFQDQNGITGSFDDTSGVLTLTGTASLAEYQAALRTVQYMNDRVNPIAGFRLLDVTVQDGTKSSDPSEALVDVDTELQPATISVSTSELTYVENNPPIDVAASFSLDDQDTPRADGTGTRFLQGATVRVDGYVEGEDFLTATPTGSIEGEFDANQGILFMTGRASFADYQTAVRSVKYENVSEAPTTEARQVVIGVLEGATDILADPIPVGIQSLDNPPSRTSDEPADLSMLENGQPVSLGLADVAYDPPSDKEPDLVFTVVELPDEFLGDVEFPDGSVAELEQSYSIEQLQGAHFVPGLNSRGQGTFSFTVAGFNPILNEPDPASLTESLMIDVVGVETNSAAEAFTAQTYRDLLHRNPTEEELAAVPTDLNDAASRQAEVVTITTGQEYLKQEVQELYSQHLQRDATEAEVASWFTPDFEVSESFEDDFLPLRLEEVGGGTTVVADGVVTLSDQRHFIRTIDSDLFVNNFVAEVTTTVSDEVIDDAGDKIAFFGMGPGEPDPAFFDEPRVQPFVQVRIAPDDFAFDGFASADVVDNDTVDQHPTDTVGGSGTHRLRLSWDADTQTATFEVDQDYAGGDFVADHVFDPLDGSDNGFDATNANVFFGGFGNVSFDDFSITGDAVTPNLDQVQAEILGSEEFETTRGEATLEGFADALYDDLLGRQPTEEERAAVVDELVAGGDPVTVARDVAASRDAAVRRVDGLYGELLRRPADLFELVDGSRRFQAEGSAPIIESLVSSDEYFARYAESSSTIPFSQDQDLSALILQWLTSPADDGNIQTTSGFESVGILGDTVSGRGGGTLISSDQVLTAAHLVASRNVSEMRFTIGGETYTVSQVHVHPDYSPSELGTDAANDIAMLQLSREVTNVTPSPLFRDTPAIGEELTLVGFGPRSGDDGEFGTKHVGTTPLDGITEKLFTWTYDGVDEATTVRGDSGSPQFIIRDGEYYLASIASGGTLTDSFLGDFAYNTRVDGYVDWLASLCDE